MSARSVPSAPLPDLNSGPYPFEVVQRAVDQAGLFVLYAAPAGAASGGARQYSLRHLEVELDGPDRTRGLRAANHVGAEIGRLDLKIMPIADDLEALPGRPLGVVELQPDRSQRVALQEASFGFADGSGFRGFGTGRTFPFEGPHGRQLVVAAVGAILEPSGALAGMEGNFVLAGTYDAAGGFRGNVTVRVVDPTGRVHTAQPPPAAAPRQPLEPGHTYFLLRAQKAGPQQESRFSLGPGGDVRGIDVPLELTRIELSATAEGGLRSHAVVGDVVGREVGFTAINPVAPSPFPGTTEAPIRFQGASKYTFFGEDGTVLGGYQGNFVEGRSFLMQLAGAPGLPALRFGYFGPLFGGTGCCEGFRGVLYGVAGVGLGPHVFSNLYVALVLDPEGRFRADRRTRRGEESP